jgi:predicted nucleic acid-binding protein
MCYRSGRTAKSVLIDTGPLVATLRRRDAHHEWARAHFDAATEPFSTCEAVISETLFLLEPARGGKEAL